MKRRNSRWVGFVLVGLAACTTSPVKDTGLRSPASDSSPPPIGQRHVHFLHVDGIVSDIFKDMLDAGQLPNFSSLIERGKLSLNSSTVDKSETMKVIQSYLTSKRETEVAGWWQFERDTLRFRNYDTDPIGLLDYILGLKFPKNPTIHDVLAGKGENIAAGFTLQRRGVPFQNYSRNYFEGIQGVFNHHYLDQAHATMGSFLKTLKRIIEDPQQKFPIMTSSLLAAPDEMAHWRGPVFTAEAGLGSVQGNEFCADRKQGKERKKDVLEQVFRLLDERTHANANYFTRVEYPKPTDSLFQISKNKATRFCVRVPNFRTFAHPSSSGPTGIGQATLERADPAVVLAMMVVDMELGRLIKTFQNIEFDSDGKAHLNTSPAPGNSGNTLFDRTLFIVMGDHGFSDTKAGMSRDIEKHSGAPMHADSLRENFVDYLNRSLNLDKPDKKKLIEGDSLIAIDDKDQPIQLGFVHKDTFWQTDEQKSRVREAEQWANEFLDDVIVAVKAELHEKYWYLAFLKEKLIDPKIDKGVKPYRQTAVDILARVYLHGDPKWVKAENQAMKQLYDRHVRVIYGGAARSNAEIFLPATTGGQVDWGKRPAYPAILQYRPTGAKSVLNALQENPGVGLIFIRKNNETLIPATPTPARMEISVLDRFNNSGTITIRRDTGSSELLFHYRKDDASRLDPLETGTLGEGAGTTGTYADWTQWGIEKNLYYHNVVAGMGDYLYTTNPAVGDISLMRAQGWNFGDNGGSHGGVHREEKLSFMLVSGPGVGRGELFSGGARVYREGQVVRSNSNFYPTVLDMAPTALNWLGYGPNAFADFANNEYPAYLEKWVSSQRADILRNLDQIDTFKDALKSIGFDHLRISRFESKIERLLQFMPPHAPALPSFDGYRVDGNLLNLGN